jgi:hypothetical protein
LGFWKGCIRKHYAYDSSLNQIAKPPRKFFKFKTYEIKIKTLFTF